MVPGPPRPPLPLLWALLKRIEEVKREEREKKRRMGDVWPPNTGAYICSSSGQMLQLRERTNFYELHFQNKSLNF